MSRDDGFAVADMDSAYFDDAKMRDLWQRVQDPDRMARAVILHAATLLGSWRQGERITVSQAAPLWMPHDGGIVDDMKSVRLLDRSGKIPLGPWNQWFGVAFKRREVRRETGRAGGLASGKSRSTDGEASVQVESSPTEPVRPSVRSVRSGPTGPSVPPRGKNDDGLTTPTTKEEALLALSARYQRGEMQQLDYERQRKELLAS